MKASHFLVLTALAAPIAPAETLAQTSLETAISHLQYRELGPALMGGRIADLAVVESKPQVFYIATGTGGVWKTENHGTSWTPLFDDQPASSIGDVTLDQSNPNLVWVGTGEPQNRQSSGWGNGVYKSTDGGSTWRHMGLERTKHIGRILIHPRNPDIVYVAAVGDLWAANEERGVYRTLDGGETWERVLYVDEHTGAIDLAMDPGDPNTVFAAMYQRRRTGWGFNGGGPEGLIDAKHPGPRRKLDDDQRAALAGVVEKRCNRGQAGDGAGRRCPDFQRHRRDNTGGGELPQCPRFRGLARADAEAAFQRRQGTAGTHIENGEPVYPASPLSRCHGADQRAAEARSWR